MNLRHIAVHHFRRRKIKMGFLILGLVIGVSAVVALITLTRTMGRDIAEKLDTFGANILIVPQSDALSLSYGGMVVSGVSFDRRSLSEADLEKIETIEHKESLSILSPKLLSAARVNGMEVLLVGIHFGEELRLKKWWRISGRAPKGPEDLLVGAEAAAKLGLAAADSVVLLGGTFIVQGILAPTGAQDDALIFADLSVVQELLGKPQEVSLIEVAALCNTCPIDQIVGEISAQLPHAKVSAIKQVVLSRMETLDRFRLFSLGVSVFVVAIGALIVFTNMMASVNERTREIGIFRAIGFRRSHVVKIILFEAFLVGVVGGVLGYLVGLGASRLGAPLLLIASGESAVRFDGDLAVLAIGLSIGVGMLAAIYPALRASKLDPTVALRSL
ncbi:MAG: ABC transporter permease [Candidatus Latescibacterota bacterium]